MLSPSDLMKWSAAIFLVFLFLLVAVITVWAVVKEFKKNPLKKSFDTDEKEQDK
jgi:hypothetical protein